MKEDGTMSEIILEVQNLKKYYQQGTLFQKKESVKAVDDVSFVLHRKETLAIVGESGCGKSTTVKSLIRLTEPTSGKVILHGEDFTSLKGKELREARKKLKIIFQDPYSSLNPRMTVRDIIAEPIDIEKTWKTRSEREEMVLETMKLVGLDPTWINRYPHEFSGGQRQRIGIARAIILKPDIVICDEPVSALDVSIQAKIINLLKQLQEELNISYIFISHDLPMVRYISHRMVVMYLGAVMEEGPALDIYEFPQHPYSKALTKMVGEVVPRAPIGAPLKGAPASPLHPPKGCLFSDRCPDVERRCLEERPPLREWADRRIACWHI